MNEHEELLFLRTLADKQQTKLTENPQTIEAQKAQIKKQRSQIETMIQALLHARKKMFGPSTEASKDMEEYIIPSSDTCTRCGGDLKVIGKRIVRTEVEHEPAKLKVKQIVQQVAKCVKCGTEEIEYDTCHFQKAAVPVPPLAHSISTPSLIAQIMYQKFVMGMLAAIVSTCDFIVSTQTNLTIYYHLSLSVLLIQEGIYRNLT